MCAECSGVVLDAGEELVCRSCGVVKEKQDTGWKREASQTRVDYVERGVGGFMGPLEPNPGEKRRGLPGSPSSYGYLKKVSDYSGREDSTVYACVKMIERVCEKLSLPKIVTGEAILVARKLFIVKRQKTDVTSAAVSAFSVITACKIWGITSIGVREIVEAHRALGRRVKVSSLISLSLDSPVRVGARRAEDYVSRVVARLPENESLSKDLRAIGSSEASYFARLRDAAFEALEAADSCSRGGHSPCALAATAVYAGETLLAKRESRKRILTQKDVADCVGVAEYTIREQFGEIFRQALPVVERSPTPRQSS